MLLHNLTETSLPAYNPPGVKLALGSLCALSVIIGMPLIYVIIRYLLRESSHHRQAINKLMLFEHAMTSLNVVAISLQLLVLTLPFPIGKVACTALDFLILSDGMHRAIGSFGMAIFR